MRFSARRRRKLYYEGANIGPLASKRVRLREVKADMIGYTSELMAKAANKGTRSTCP